MGRVQRRRFGVATVAAAVAATVVISGCTAAPPATERPVGAEVGSIEDEGLQRYYAQELSWSECDGFECTTLEVPLSYQDAGGESIELQVLRAPAQGEKVGSLVVNPGGPGGSGVSYAQHASTGFGQRLIDSYDIVGFDPRGVASSTPVRCVDDEFMDRMAGSDPTPDDAAAEAELEQRARDFMQACADNAGPLLGHISTVDAARDIDILRAALGEPELDYLGASYGTFLGTTYATLFPDKVGRLVLDGAVSPTLTGLEMGLGQAEGFERATRAYAENCVASGNCPLGADVESALARIPQFLDEVSADPLPVREDVLTELTEGWAFWGIIVVMYDEEAWPLLDMAFRMAIGSNDGSMLMAFASLYHNRNQRTGVYESNQSQVIYAVNCLDRRDPGTEGMSEDEILQAYLDVSPTWGQRMAGESMCADWPVEAQERITDYSAAGAPPIMVIGTTRDPATPYEWSVALADLLDSGFLVTYEGDGHTAYTRGSACIDAAVEDFLIEGTVPADGLTC